MTYQSFKGWTLQLNEAAPQPWPDTHYIIQNRNSSSPILHQTNTGPLAHGSGKPITLTYLSWSITTVTPSRNHTVPGTNCLPCHMGRYNTPCTLLIFSGVSLQQLQKSATNLKQLLFSILPTYPWHLNYSSALKYWVGKTPFFPQYRI